MKSEKELITYNTYVLWRQPLRWLGKPLSAPRNVRGEGLASRNGITLPPHVRRMSRNKRPIRLCWLASTISSWCWNAWVPSFPITTTHFQHSPTFSWRIGDNPDSQLLLCGSSFLYEHWLQLRRIAATELGGGKHNSWEAQRQWYFLQYHWLYHQALLQENAWWGLQGRGRGHMRSQSPLLLRLCHILEAAAQEIRPQQAYRAHQIH